MRSSEPACRPLLVTDRVRAAGGGRGVSALRGRGAQDQQVGESGG
ncbi:hypothetical protein [Nitrosomonas nitrosa]|nr:hypothetical protein [Nitrosomonas nitrosa]